MLSGRSSEERPRWSPQATERRSERDEESRGGAFRRPKRVYPERACLERELGERLLIFAHHHLRFNLFDGLQDHGDHNQKSGAANGQGGKASRPLHY